MHERKVTVAESGNGPYGQFITSGRHVLGADEPIELGGMDTGADPFELLLAALGACTAMTIRTVRYPQGPATWAISVQLRHVQRAAGSDIKDRFERVISLDGEISARDRGTMPRQPDAEAQLRHHIAVGGAAPKRAAS